MFFVLKTIPKPCDSNPCKMAQRARILIFIHLNARACAKGYKGPTREGKM